MLKRQQRPMHLWSAVADHRRLIGGQIVRVAPWPGELTVVDGRVWLTRRGDNDDHVLDGGQRIALAGNAEALVEAWDARVGATVRWLPAPQALPRGGLVVVARRMVCGLRALAWRFVATARRAASSASRAQGRICSGDSMACGGTVQ